MAIRITAIRLSGGTTHQHIARLWWVDPANQAAGEKNNSRQEIVDWIEKQDGKAYVDDSQGHRADVRVVTPTYGSKYLRTYRDRVATDNLLALPRK